MTVVRTFSKVLFVAAVCGLVASTAMAGLTLNVFLAGTSSVKPNGATSMDVATPTGTVNLEIWARVTGSDGLYTNDGLTKVYASFKTSNGGLVKGNLVSSYLPDEPTMVWDPEANEGEGGWVLTYTPNFWASGTDNHVGTAQDLDLDGDLDNGSDNAATADDWFIARGQVDVYKMGTTNNLGWFKLGKLTLTLDGWGPGGPSSVTEIWAEAREFANVNAWKEDGVVKGDLNYPTTGQKVTLFTSIPEPATLVLMAVGGGFGLILRRKKR